MKRATSDPSSSPSSSRASQANSPAGTGRIAVVTGAGRGIGAATARLLAEQGDRVVLVSRTSQEVQEQAAWIQEHLGTERAWALTADVSDPAQVDALFQQVLDQWGPVDVLINNAAVLIQGKVTELSLSDFDRVFDVNVRGSFLCAQQVFRQRKALRESTPAGLVREASIVNLSSLGGIRSTSKFPGLCAYSTSKHAIVGLTESLAVEGKPLGIRVNCVAPGAVETRMLKEAAPFLKTSTRPDDVAELIRYLCDPVQARCLNGSIIEVHSNE